MLQSDDVAELADRGLEAFLAAGDDESTRSVFRMGPFLVGPDGYVQPASLQVSPRFTVRWRKYTVRATIEVVGTSTHVAAGAGTRGVGQMHLEVVTGRIPSTASTIGTDRRERAFGLLETLPGKLPRDWRLHLLADHHYGFAKVCPLPIPTSAAEMLTAVTSFLLDLDPYLDALAAAGFGLTEAAGTAKT